MKYLAVDLGNVICEVDFSSFIRELSKTTNISLEDVNSFLLRTQKLHDLGLTNITDELKDRFHLESPFTIEHLVTEWNNAIKQNMFMTSTLSGLISKGDTKIALLSNIGPEHAALMPNILTSHVFDNSIKFFSYEVGARKPSFVYYKTFLDMHPEFKGCVYIDDRPENVAAGIAFGFNAQYFALDDLKSSDNLVNRVLQIQDLM